MKILTGHTSFETAYEIADYPYGFKLRCKMRVWVGTKQNLGQRIVTCTSNPKRNNEVWNKPKHSTYGHIVLLALADNDYVTNVQVRQYITWKELNEFEKNYGAYLDDYQKKQIAFLRISTKIGGERK